MRKAALLFIILLLCPVLAHAEDEGIKFTKHYANSTLMVTDNKLYGVEMLVIGDMLKVGMNSVDIIVHDAEDHDLMGAEVSVTPWMAEMGHGVKSTPTVMERGGGLYSVENVEISMPGTWQLRVRVSKDGREDTAVFEMRDIHTTGMGHMHMPSAEEVPPDLNVSRIVESENGIFRVTWMSDAEPVPVNKVHGWKVYIETADGKPVTDAEIAIDGDMPEHGHGLPTKPRVAKNLGGGMYAIEGMKFQMPGWWVVHFKITAGGKADTVTFNLRPR